MTIILAKLLGLYLFSMGFAFLVNPSRLRKILRQASNDESFLFLGGLFALLIGAFIVSVHNDWVLGWPVIITILGWWSMIKGFVLLIYPGSLKIFRSFQEKSNTFYRVISLIYVLLGLFLICKAWGVL